MGGESCRMLRGHRPSGSKAPCARTWVSTWYVSAKFVVKKVENGPNLSFMAWPMWRNVVLAPSEKAVVAVCINTCCKALCTAAFPCAFAWLMSVVIGTL